MQLRPHEYTSTKNLACTLGPFATKSLTVITATMPEKERRLFRRKVSKCELKVLRNWLDVESGRLWKNEPDDATTKVGLYIHELFGLNAWRKREEAKQVNIPKITVRASFFTFEQGLTDSPSL